MNTSGQLRLTQRVSSSIIPSTGHPLGHSLWNGSNGRILSNTRLAEPEEAIRDRIKKLLAS